MTAKLPDPDMPTMERLMGIAKLGGPERAGEASAKMFSAIAAFLIGSVGPVKTSEILRDWAAVIQRRSVEPIPR